jgi:organic radical activating enzyme
MKKLRLLMTAQCNRDCEGCCNKDWDLEELPIWDSDVEYDIVLITGGEPMLFPRNVSRIANHIKTKTPKTKVYLYTALANRHLPLLVAEVLDGVTLTLHEQKDVLRFNEFNAMLLLFPKAHRGKSLRLNVFEGVDISQMDTSLWTVKDGIEWIDDCPLPEDEEFMQI